MSIRALRQLALNWGVQLAYEDCDHRRQTASPQALLAVLRSLGAPVDRIADAPDALRARRLFTWQHMLEPVILAPDSLEAELRIPASSSHHRFRASLTLEEGQQHAIEGRIDELPLTHQEDIDGSKYEARQLTMPIDLPHGYHQLHVEIANQRAEALVVSAPKKVFSSWKPGRDRSWGVFMPLYALQTERSWGAGDLTDLEALMLWSRSQGAEVAATLPLMASFWDQTGDYSPYSPASRLFWNEFYLDVTRVENFADSPRARQLVESSEMQQQIQRLREGRHVDYDLLVEVKQRVLRQLSDNFFNRDQGQRRAALDAFLQHRPEVSRYARFRSACLRHGLPWMNWDPAMREDRIDESDCDPAVVRYHQFVQWQTHLQLERMSSTAADQGLMWYLDMPLGVSRAGYDVWAYRDAFAIDANGGAPPDPFFAKGQNWCFPPLHPEGLRRQGYRYFIEVLRNQFSYASLLRIDHVASLHRLFWIPEGHEATDGAYVRYPAEELYAICAIESHRAGAGIVGENLGTVPKTINRALRRHGLQGMYVLPFETEPEKKPPVPEPSSLTLASLNTHDMPPFAAFWSGSDIDERIKIGLLDADNAEGDRKWRASFREALQTFLQKQDLLAKEGFELRDVLQACLKFLARSKAEVVLVNLEDLWLETVAQNMPGTFEEHPNWKSKSAKPMEAFAEDPGVLELLQIVDHTRRH